MIQNTSSEKSMPTALPSSLTQHWFTAFVVGLGFSIAVLIWQFQHFVPQHNQSLRTLLAISAQYAQSALDQQNPQALRATMDHLSDHPSILYGVVIDHTGERVAKFDKGNSNSGNRWLSETLFGVSYTLKQTLPTAPNSTHQGGYLQIEVDTHDMASSFTAQVKPVIVAIFLIALALTTLINLLNRHQLSKPLGAISQALNLFNQQTLTAESLNFSQKTLNPALQQLIEQINLLCERLKSNILRRERAEDDLRKNLASLDAIVAERTENLRNSTQRLQSLVTTLESRLDNTENLAQQRLDFLTIMSHEIRTNLSSVVAVLRSVATSMEESRHFQSIEVALKTGQFLLQSIEDVLSLSHLDNEKIKLKSQQFDVGELVEQITSIYYSEAKVKGVTLYSHIAPTLPSVFIGDEARLRQVLDTLTQNVLKFCDSGLLELQAFENDSGQVAIVLRCNCINLTDDAFLAIFKPIYSDEGSDAAPTPNDWGLCLVSRLVKLMNAQTDFSRENQWFQLRLDLPLKSFVDDTELTNTLEKIKPLRAVILTEGPSPLTDTLIHYLQGWSLTVKLIQKNTLVDQTTVTASSDAQYIRQSQVCFIDAIDNNGALMQLLDLSQPSPHLIFMSEPDALPTQLTLTRLGINHSLLLPLHRKPLIVALLLCAQQLNQTQPSQSPGSLPQPNNVDINNSATPRRALNILVVDDDPAHVTLCREVLRRAHARISVAHNGLEALETLSSGPFDAILMDCQMPEMDGYEATALIRESVPYEKLPIIGMTADSTQANHARCHAAGMNDCLSKPVELSTLTALLDRWVDA